MTMYVSIVNAFCVTVTPSGLSGQTTNLLSERQIYLVLLEIGQINEMFSFHVFS